MKCSVIDQNLLLIILYSSLSIENHKNVETIESEYERISSHSSGITASLDKNLLISSNEIVSEGEMEDESNHTEDGKEESKDGLKENENKQINCPKRSTSDNLLTEHTFKRQRV